MEFDKNSFCFSKEAPAKLNNLTFKEYNSDTDLHQEDVNTVDWNENEPEIWKMDQKRENYRLKTWWNHTMRF